MKKKSKPTTPHLLLVSEDAMVGALNRYVEVRLDVERRTAKHELAIAELNSAFDAKIQADREELASLETSLQLFAQNHRADLFTVPKSREYANATLGFRTCPPAVERVVEKEKWDTIAERIDQLPWGIPYIKDGKISVDKEAILRDRGLLTAEQLRSVGLQIGQAEVFYIEPKADSAERVTKEVEVAA